LIEWQSGRLLLRLPETTVSVVFLPAGRTVISAQLSFVGTDQYAHYKVNRWNLNDGQTTVLTEWDDHSAHLNGGLAPGMLQVSADGRWLVDLWEPPASSGPADGLVVWNAANGEKHLAVPTARWYKLVRGGHTLVTMHAPAVPSAPCLQLFDLESGATHGLFPNTSGMDDVDVPLVVPSPNGQLLAVGVQDPRPHPMVAWPKLVNWLERLGIDLNPSQSFVALLQAADGRELARLPFGPSRILNVPELADEEPTIVFSPDARRLAVLGEDGIRIWDLPIRRPWALILSLAAIPPVGVGLLIPSARLLRRRRAPRPALSRAI
jgi:hypothetical protein